MEYKTTKEQCQSMINGICSRCGGKLEPIETVDNSGDPTFWQGCKKCLRFDSGVDLVTYLTAKELIENCHFRPYSHIDHDIADSEELKKYKIMEQISGACDVVNNVFQTYKKIIQSNGEMIDKK